MKKFKYYVDLIDGTVTTGKVHPYYKGFRNKKQAYLYSEIIKSFYSL